MRNRVLAWNLWNSDSVRMGFNHYWKWAKLATRVTSKPSALLEASKNVLTPLPPQVITRRNGFCGGDRFLDMVEPAPQVGSHWKKGYSILCLKHVYLRNFYVVR